MRKRLTAAAIVMVAFIGGTTVLSRPNLAEAPRPNVAEAKEIIEPDPEPVPEEPCINDLGKDFYKPLPGGIECARKLEGEWGGQCLAFVKDVLGLGEDPKFRGHAAEVMPNSDVPEKGGVVLLAGNKWEHVAIIYDITDQGDLVLLESNWNGDERIVFGRTLATSSTQIRGYYKPATEAVLE
jgi:hypothetical protein